MQQVTVTVYGHVQGVGFRDAAQRAAQKLNITGFVRNEPDGSVYIRAQGYGDALEEFLAWAAKGPRGSNVSKVEHYYIDVREEFADFSVR